MIDHPTDKRNGLDKEIDAHVVATDELKSLVDRLMTMCGCGPVFALTLITDALEFGRLDRRQIAAPCGAVGSPQFHRCRPRTDRRRQRPARKPTRHQRRRGRGRKIACLATVSAMIATLDAMAGDNKP